MSSDLSIGQQTHQQMTASSLVLEMFIVLHWVQWTLQPKRPNAGSGDTRGIGSYAEAGEAVAAGCKRHLCGSATIDSSTQCSHSSATPAVPLFRARDWCSHAASRQPTAETASLNQYRGGILSLETSCRQQCQHHRPATSPHVLGTAHHLSRKSCEAIILA